MKYFLLLFFFMTSAYCQEIEGTLVKEETLKTIILVNDDETICKVKVDKVKNLLEEDSFGNPAYQVYLHIILRAKGFLAGNRLIRKVTVNNLFKGAQSSQVKDLEYANKDEHVFMDIDRDGHVQKVSFQFQYQTVSCQF